MNIDYSIEELDLSKQNLTILPDLSKYTKLKVLNCSCNELTRLDNLPPGLKELYCSRNNLTSLDNLPPGLKELACWNNKITSLDNLPPELKKLYCGNDEWKMKYFEKTNSSRPL